MTMYLLKGGEQVSLQTRPLIVRYEPPSATPFRLVASVPEGKPVVVERHQMLVLPRLAQPTTVRMLPAGGDDLFPPHSVLNVLIGPDGANPDAGLRQDRPRRLRTAVGGPGAARAAGAHDPGDLVEHAERPEAATPGRVGTRRRARVAGRRVRRPTRRRHRGRGGLLPVDALLRRGRHPGGRTEHLRRDGQRRSTPTTRSSRYCAAGSPPGSHRRGSTRSPPRRPRRFGRSRSRPDAGPPRWPRTGTRH